MLEGNHTSVRTTGKFCAHLELSGHQKNHTGEKVHKCGKASSKLFNLTQHKGVHSIQKHYSWENAGKVLKNITEFICKRDPTSVRDVSKPLLTIQALSNSNESIIERRQTLVKNVTRALLTIQHFVTSIIFILGRNTTDVNKLSRLLKVRQLTQRYWN